MAVRTVVVALRAEVGSYIAGMNSAAKAVAHNKDAADSAGKSLAALGARAAGVFAAGGLVAGLKASVDAASDLNETTSKSRVIFGQGADAVEKFGAAAATAFGQSKQQAIDAAATFGTFGKAAGLSGTALAGFSTKFSALASDMASFSNTSVDQAIEAIGAGLRGESEPLRQYGVLLDDASLRQEAFNQHIISTTKNVLTPQQRVLAAQALIFKQTSDAQGDFARTSDGLANKERILSANVENLKASIGEHLLPVVSDGTSILIDHGKTILQVGAGLTVLGAGYVAVNAAATAYSAAQARAAAATALLNGSSAAAAASEAKRALNLANLNVLTAEAAFNEARYEVYMNASAVASAKAAVAGDALATARAEQAAAAGLANTATTGFAAAASKAGLIIGGLVVADAAATYGFKKLQDQIVATAPDLDELVKRFVTLKSNTDLSAAIGDADKFAASVKRISDPGTFTNISDNIGGPLHVTAKSLREAKDQVDTYDKALTTLVQNGAGDQAATVFATMTAELVKQGLSVDEIKKAFPQYEGALRGIATQTAITSANSATLTAKQKSLADATKSVNTALQDSINKFSILNQGYLDGRAAARQLADAEDALAKSVKDSAKKRGDTSADVAAKQRAEQSSLDDLAGALNDVAVSTFKHTQSTKGLDAAVTEASGKLEGEHRALVKAAESTGLSKQAAEAYATAVLKTPDQIATQINLKGYDAAKAKLDTYKDEIRVLKNQGVTLSVKADVSSALASIRALTHSTGTSVFGGTRRAAGGFIAGPGGPTDDQVPALLSNGEFVVTAEATKRNRSLLEAMNAKRFAAGGMVRASNGGASGLSGQVAAGLMSGASLEAVQAGVKAAAQLESLWQASLERADQAAQRATLVAARNKALADQVKADKSKDKKDDAAARAAVKSANKDLADFDTKASQASKQKRFDKQQEALATAETAAQARQSLKDNEAAYTFDHMSSADQLKALDKRIAGEKKYSDAWVADSTKREQIQKSVDDAQAAADQKHLDDLQKAVDLAQGKYDTALTTLNGLLDDQAKLQQQITDAQVAYNKAVDDADVALGKQIDSIKAARTEALAGWADITQKSVVAAAPSANTLIKNASAQIDQFKEWQQRVGTARAQGISEAVIATLGLDQGPQALGQLRKLNAATGEQVAQLNALVDTRQSLAAGQTNTEAAAGTGQVGKDIKAAQSEAAAAKQAAQDTLDAATAQTNSQLQDLGVQHGRTYVEAVAQGMASGLPGLISAVQNVQGAFGALSAAQAAQGHAAGGFVYGPGSGTSDSVNTRLSNGEFVVNAQDAARNRQLLEAVNGGRYVSANRIASTSSSTDTWGMETQLRRLTEATHEQTSIIRQGQSQPLLTPAGW